MPDDSASQHVEQDTNPQCAATPSPANQPNGIPTGGISDADQQSQIDNLEDRMKVGERWMISLTALMAVIAAIGVGVAGLQWWVMRGQIDEMRHQFRQDQRPYVMPTKVEPFLPMPGHPIQINVRWVNYGKSPALQVRTRAAVLFGNNALEQADKWFEVDAQNPLIGAPEMIIPPGIPPNIADAQYASIFSTRGLTTEEIEDFGRLSFYVALVIHLEYFDSFGAKYSTESCFSSFSNGAIPNCPKHNVIN